MDAAFLLKVKAGNGLFRNCQRARPLPELLADHGIHLARISLRQTLNSFNLIQVLAFKERLYYYTNAEGIGIIMSFFSLCWSRRADETAATWGPI